MTMPCDCVERKWIRPHMKAAMPFTISDLRQCPEFFDTVADRIGRRGRPASSIRRHEDRQTETGEMVQRLIDPDQPPEPLLLLLHREGGDAKSLGAVDCDMDRKIDQG